MNSSGYQCSKTVQNTLSSISDYSPSCSNAQGGGASLLFIYIHAKKPPTSRKTTYDEHDIKSAVI